MKDSIDRLLKDTIETYSELTAGMKNLTRIVAYGGLLVGGSILNMRCELSNVAGRQETLYTEQQERIQRNAHAIEEMSNDSLRLYAPGYTRVAENVFDVRPQKP